MEVVKTIRCKECGGLLELDIYHLAQKRHLECGYKADKKRGKKYYENYLKRQKSLL